MSFVPSNDAVDWPTHIVSRPRKRVLSPLSSASTGAPSGSVLRPVLSIGSVPAEELSEAWHSIEESGDAAGPSGESDDVRRTTAVSGFGRIEDECKLQPAWILSD